MAKTKLKQLEVDEVSLVDAGANQGAHVKLYKNRDGKPGEGFVPGQEEKTRSGLRKLFSAIGKALNIPDDDIESAADSIEKADNGSCAGSQTRSGMCAMRWKAAWGVLCGMRKLWTKRP